MDRTSQRDGAHDAHIGEHRAATDNDASEVTNVDEMLDQLVQQLDWQYLQERNHNRPEHGQQRSNSPIRSPHENGGLVSESASRLWSLIVNTLFEDFYAFDIFRGHGLTTQQLQYLEREYYTIRLCISVAQLLFSRLANNTTDRGISTEAQLHAKVNRLVNIRLQVDRHASLDQKTAESRGLSVNYFRDHHDPPDEHESRHEKFLRAMKDLRPMRCFLAMVLRCTLSSLFAAMALDAVFGTTFRGGSGMAIVGWAILDWRVTNLLLSLTMAALIADLLLQTPEPARDDWRNQAPDTFSVFSRALIAFLITKPLTLLIEEINQQRPGGFIGAFASAASLLLNWMAGLSAWTTLLLTFGTTA
ncbi:hypothetical protein B0T16DRAFT_506030 [Cercophora newfieldiana]|uniref:Uncharacterized protein n=1 Tax=Cercophora newfieldiana TaxID=92897 RepID=A0AA39YLE0_9PEZI|nr:hypothetical protein B0T16DRAFT_506030 [Cercophora newfieldiana]